MVQDEHGHEISAEAKKWDGRHKPAFHNVFEAHFWAGAHGLLSISRLLHRPMPSTTSSRGFRRESQTGGTLKHARPFESLFKAQLWPGREKGADAAPCLSNCISINATTETHKKGLLTGNSNPTARWYFYHELLLSPTTFYNFICILFVFKSLLQIVSNQHWREWSLVFQRNCWYRPMPRLLRCKIQRRSNLYWNQKLPSKWWFLE